MAITGSASIGAVIGKRRYTRNFTLPKIGANIMAMRGGKKKKKTKTTNSRGGKKRR